MSLPHYRPGDSFQASTDQEQNLLRGMDLTMVQKLAFASAHFQLGDGARILDLGCAGGKSSYNLALLNPRLQVIGVDYNQGYIDQARNNFQLPNLSFIQGDARNLDMGTEKFDAVFNSSVMHEIYSYSGYSHNAARHSIASQLSVLNPGGTILLRDFVRPDHPENMVYMDVREDAPVNGETPSDILLRYSHLARALLPEAQRGFYVEETKSPDPGWRRFYLPHDWAYEFIWRKDYRDRFVPEAEEKYGVWTAGEYRAIPEALGARVSYTAPYRNPWLLLNRYEGKVRLYDEAFRPLDLPPSNFIALIKRVEPDESVRLSEHKLTPAPARYLQSSQFEHRHTGIIHDLVRRPGDVLDILPYDFDEQNRLAIYAKSAYPRPMLNIYPRQMTANLDGKTWSGHVVEPLAAANQSQSKEESVAQILSERAGIGPAETEFTHAGRGYYTAPGDVNEYVSSAFVKVRNVGARNDLAGNFSRFSSDGEFRSYNAQDLLRGIQVGMLAEARLEMNLYALMQDRGIVPDKWIGEAYDISPRQSGLVADFNVLQATTNRAVFKPVDVKASFLKVVRSTFIETGADPEGAGNKVIAMNELEFAFPDQDGAGKGYSTNGVTVFPVVKDKSSGEFLVGLQVRDFPALQDKTGSSGLVTAPGMRLPPRIHTLDDMREIVAQRYGVESGDVRQLGEAYFPSLGILPCRIFPCIVSRLTTELENKCSFVPLRDIFSQAAQIRDAQLLVGMYRLTHALGVWQDYQNPLQKPERQPIIG